MSKNKADEQVIVWLKSICQDSNSFNAINAENALNLIAKLRKQNRSLGAHFCNLKKQRNKILKERRKELELERDRILLEMKIQDMFGYPVGTHF